MEQAPLAQQSTTTAKPAQPTHDESQVLKRRPSVVRSSYEFRSSSAPRGFSPPQPAHDVASKRLARFLAQQDSDPSPRGKGISIGEGS